MGDFCKSVQRVPGSSPGWGKERDRNNSVTHANAVCEHCPYLMFLLKNTDVVCFQTQLKCFFLQSESKKNWKWWGVHRICMSDTIVLSQTLTGGFLLQEVKVSNDFSPFF